MNRLFDLFMVRGINSVPPSALINLTRFFVPGLLALFTLANPAFAEVSDKTEKLTAISEMQSASEENIDRLKGWISDSDNEVEVEASLKLFNLYWQGGNNAGAEELFQTLFSNLTELTTEQTLNLWIAKSRFEDSRNNYELAETIIKQHALPLAGSDSPQLARVYQLISVYLMRQRKIGESAVFADKAVVEYKRSENYIGLAYAYATIGINMTNLGRLADALDYHHRARKLVEVHGSKGDVASSYYNLGELYQKTNDLDNALSFYQKALQLDIELNALGNVASDHYTIATIYQQKELFNEALDHIQQSIDLFAKIDAAQLLSRSYIEKSRILKGLGQQDERKTALIEAEKNAIISNSDMQHKYAHFEFGNYYKDIEDYVSAVERFEKALQIADKLELLVKQQQYSYALYSVYEKLGDADSALQYLSTAYSLKLQLVDDAQLQEAEKHKRDINLLEEQLKVEQLELKRTEQAQVIEAQRLSNLRNTLLFAFALVLMLGAGYLLWQRRRLALLRAKLYQDTLAQKDRMFADVSHELRTPLTSLKLQVDALQRNLIKDVDASYEKISRKVMDINQLITQIHDLAQSDTGSLILEKTRCNLVKYFEQWDKEFRDLVEDKGLTYQSRISLHATEAEFDAQRIRQVMCNLLSNSCFYTDKPGTVSVNVSSDSENLSVKIEDSEPGVAEKEHKKIFQRLYRVEKSRSRQTGGSGLGLAICKSLVEAHGGSIHAQESKLGGLCVVVTVPIRA